ncbi:MAG: acetyl-CoA C-acetyltransferase [Chloroflexia bacterium]|jgi:acetyl-CoA C-acetyltransferase|nr:acetyl-CoA C-acetyltransferase [Chloroflexia bacterium]
MASNNNNPVILAGARTPFGKFGGSLASVGAVELGAHVMREAMSRANIDRNDVTHNIMGCVLQGGLGMIPSRQAAFAAGLGREVTSDTVNRVCGSGIRSIELANDLIRLGHHSLIVAGGMESMSNAPFYSFGTRWGLRMGHGELRDAVLHDGLTDPLMKVHMGAHGSQVAAEEECSREQQDAWALRSHQRAIAAIDNGTFAQEIAPVTIPGKKGDTVVDTDEMPRRETSMEALAKLKPVFDEKGTVTAGNAPGINDGAAAMVVASSEYAKAHGLKPIARILGYGEAAWDTPYLAYVPAMAGQNALKKLGMTVDDLDLVEINEAFASVTLISTAKLGISEDKVNVNGGAVALGHPIGASGARILLTLIYELQRRGGGIGMAAICSGTAQGDAVIVQVGE